MSINILDTEAGTVIRKFRLLTDSGVWFDSIDGRVRNLILQMIQNDQLRKRGVDEFGEVIGYYSMTTDAITNGQKAFNTHYTFEDTGEFFNKMFVIVMRDSLVIDSDGADKVDENGTTNLFNEYGNKIIGLTDANMEKLIQLLRKKYIAYARKVLDIN
tara:strand:- start:414 stop:887 length:474 start_codon:yes stop_codon:yes gene_type:complete